MLEGLKHKRKTSFEQSGGKKGTEGMIEAFKYIKSLNTSRKKSVFTKLKNKGAHSKTSSGKDQK